MEIDVLLDGGAYCTLSPVVLSRGCLHATGPYRCDERPRPRPGRDDEHAAHRGLPRLRRAADRLRGRGADGPRGRGARPRPRAAAGDGTRCGRATRWPPARCWARTRAPSPSCARRVKRSDFHRKRRAWRGTNRGIGLSLFFHGAGFTGSGEVMLASKAALELTPRGARVLVGSTEMGQGTRTTLAQIVAEALGLPDRAGRGGRARHRARPRQRAHRRLAHLHGGGRPPEGVRGGDEGAARRPLAGGVPEAARPAAGDAAVRAAAGDRLGRRDLPRRRLRDLRLGLRRGRGRARPRDLRGAADAGDRGRRDRPRGQPADGRGAGRGRDGAGARLRAPRGGGDARRADGERPAHQLPDPHHARHAARST